MYKQTLYKILPNYVKSKILKRNNRYKKWEYGYNIDHDMVVISKTGQIGEIYEIQNLKNEIDKKLEQLRALDAGIKIGITYVENVPISVDTVEDLMLIENILNSTDENK